MKKAMVLLGCPEVPAQTPMAIYASYKLSKLGYDVTIAANPAAAKLITVSDPENYYVKNLVDLNLCLNNIKPGDFELLVGFVHKDAGSSFFVTFYHLLNTKSLALVFEKNTDFLKKYTDIVKENTDATVISVRAFHNPTPIRVIFDKALEGL